MTFHSRVFFQAFLSSIMLAVPLATNAQDLFDNGSDNTIAGPSIDVVVQDSSSAEATTLNVNGGAQVGFQLNGDGTIFIDPETSEPVSANEDQSITVNNSSILNFNEGVTADSILANDSAVVNILGGEIGDDVIANNNASVTISGSTFDDLAINDTAMAIMTGGSIDEPTVSGGEFNFSGGRVDDLFGQGTGLVKTSGTAIVDDDAFFTGTSRLEASGGQFDDELQFFDDTSALFTGGNVDDDLVVAGNAQVEIQSLTVSDTIEAAENSVTNITGGAFGFIESEGAAVVNFNGGSVVEGASAFLGGTISIGNANLVEGAAISAVLNGSITIDGATGVDLPVEAANGATVIVKGITANSLIAAARAAGVLEVEGGEANQLDITGELGGEVVLTGGTYANIDVELETSSSLTIFGSDFTYNDTPVGDLNATLGDGAFIDETGEVADYRRYDCRCLR